jgi:hypothetical protein
MLSEEREKPRKIVINNIRKSMMAIGGASAALNLPSQHPPTVEQINKTVGAISDANQNDVRILQCQMSKLVEEVNFYKEKD